MRPKESKGCKVFRSYTQIRPGLLLATYKNRCAGSAEKATLATVSPLPHMRFVPPGDSHQRSIHTCVINFPSIVKICTRFPLRSAT